MEVVATSISWVFEPVLTLALALLAYALYRGVTLVSSVFWLMLFTIPLVAFRVWARQARGLDWDIHDRKKRVVPLLVLVAYIIGDALVLWVFEKPLVPVVVLFFVWALGFFMITTFWTKISGHASGNALTSGLIVALYGKRFWPVLLLVPLVCWARVVRRDHTVGQVILGTVYSWGLLYLSRFIYTY